MDIVEMLPINVIINPLPSLLEPIANRVNTAVIIQQASFISSKQPAINAFPPPIRS